MNLFLLTQFVFSYTRSDHSQILLKMQQNATLQQNAFEVHRVMICNDTHMEGVLID